MLLLRLMMIDGWCLLCCVSGGFEEINDDNDDEGDSVLGVLRRLFL